MSDSLQPHESQHAGLPVHHQLPELTQTHVHRVGDAIQPSHPLLETLISSKHQETLISSKHQVASELIVTPPVPDQQTYEHTL